MEALQVYHCPQRSGGQDMVDKPLNPAAVAGLCTAYLTWQFNLPQHNGRLEEMHSKSRARALYSYWRHI